MPFGIVVPHERLVIESVDLRQIRDEPVRLGDVRITTQSDRNGTIGEASIPFPVRACGRSDVPAARNVNFGVTIIGLIMILWGGAQLTLGLSCGLPGNPSGQSSYELRP
jgi:hypothetical protein